MILARREIIHKLHQFLFNLICHPTSRLRPPNTNKPRRAAGSNCTTAWQIVTNVMSDGGQPEYQWTYLGLGEDSGYGPWRFQVFPSEEDVIEKFKLFANPETDATARVTSATFQPCLNEAYDNQDRRVVQNWDMRNGRWTFVGIFDGQLKVPVIERGGSLQSLNPLQGMQDTRLLIMLSQSCHSRLKVSWKHCWMNRRAPHRLISRSLSRDSLQTPFPRLTFEFWRSF